MRVLVTGANGFLGSHVVAELLRRGHEVRALVRPAARVDAQGWRAAVDVVRCDLRQGRHLAEAFDRIDALIHLAAATSGDDEAQFASSVVATEQLLEAMARSSTKRLVFCSTFSVYDFERVSGTLTEDSPLEDDLYRRDAYAIAKFWQERVVRRMAVASDWSLTVLRPGFIWGRGHEYLACLGQKLGPLHLAIGPLAHLPLTHVENCADCFVAALERPQSSGQTYNVVDTDEVTAWQYLGEHLRRLGGRYVRVPVPYWMGMSLARLAKLTSDVLFKGKGKLPSILVPARFAARFKPLRYDTRKLRESLQWRPPLSFEQCLSRTYSAEPAAVAPEIGAASMETPHV